MATLKNMTRVGADVRQIARLLQAKAPENHMLAYITPEEAQLLKNRGGTGMPDPQTGIPSFQNEFEVDDYTPKPMVSLASYEDMYESPDVSGFGGIGGYGGYGKAQTSPYINPPFDRVVSPINPQGNVNSRTVGAPVDVSVSTALPSVEEDPYYFFRDPKTNPESLSFVGPRPEDELDKQFREAGIRSDYFPQYAGKFGEVVNPYAATQEAVSFDTTQDKTVDTTPSRTIGERYSDLARSLGVKEDTLSRIGLAGLQVGLGARQARLAKEEARKAKEEQQRLAAPYQTKGAELQRQAQAGELTPAGQQSLQTVQAQAAQAASSRGGVGAQQTAARVEAIRSQLLQQQYDYGLKLSGIGDQILLGSIRTGLEADRYVNQLSNTYFTNVARTLAGSPTVIQYGVPT